MIPNLIGTEKLQPAIAINALVSNAGRFLGPALGGLVIVQWGIGPAWAVCAFCYGMPALTLLLVRTSDEDMKRSGKKLLGDAAEGIAYTARHPGIGPLMAMLIVTSTFGKPFGSLFPGFAADVFERGADGLAWLTGAVGMGAVLGGLFMAQRTTGVVGLTRVCIMQTGLIGAGLLLFMSTDIFWLAIPICIATGGASIINGVSAQTLLQHAGAGHMRGRLASLFGMVMRGGQALGSLILGVTADLIGLRLTIAITGCICVAFWLWSLRRSKAMAATLET
jgi:predicted MFS family arabinose efflux permease